MPQWLGGIAKGTREGLLLALYILGTTGGMGRTYQSSSSCFLLLFFFPILTVVSTVGLRCAPARLDGVLVTARSARKCQHRRNKEVSVSAGPASERRQRCVLEGAGEAVEPSMVYERARGGVSIDPEGGGRAHANCLLREHAGYLLREGKNLFSCCVAVGPAPLPTTNRS